VRALPNLPVRRSQEDAPANDGEATASDQAADNDKAPEGAGVPA
jgi:hypothetical protein